MFETSPFNFYRGPEKPEVIVITSGRGYFYSCKAVLHLIARKRVGILKMGTT